MAGSIKKQHVPEFKFKVALAALKGDKMVPQLCSEFAVASSQLYRWKTELLQRGAEIFSNKQREIMPSDEIEKLHATIGRLKVENDFLSKVLGRSP
jgi:transposase-like protein